MSLIERTIQVSYQHRVYFTHAVFDAGNPLLKKILTDNEEGMTRKVLIVLDESLALAQPELKPAIEGYFAAASDSLKLVCPPMILEGGERVKNSYFHVSEIQSYIDRYHIDRHSYLLGIGGGALLDVVGLAGGAAHRGGRHVRVPAPTPSPGRSWGGGQK